MKKLKKKKLEDALLRIFTKMKKELCQEIEIPEGVQVEIAENLVTVKGSEGELKRRFNFGKLNKDVKEGKVVIGHKQSTKTEKKMMNTIKAHINNMMKGVQEKFVYELKSVFSHFPMTVEVNENVVTIKNFLGEKIPRTFKVPEGAEIKIDKENITVSALDKEIAGRAAALFETSTKVGNRDRRVFQDGVYITNKAGKEM